MMAAECAADELEAISTTRNIAIAPHLDPAKVSNYIAQMTHYAEVATHKRQYDPTPIKSYEDTLADGAGGMLKAFKAMRDSGTLEQFKKEAAENHRKAQSAAADM